MEVWKDVVGYEGKYMVSNKGLIMSLPKATRKTSKILVPQVLKSGYLAVDLCCGDNIKRHLIHRLVCLSFMPELEKEQVNHLDGNKSNNCLSNLEWCSRSENQKHAFSIGLKSAKGEKNSQSKLNKDNVFTIMSLVKYGYKKITIAKGFSISPSTISDIIIGRSWGHLKKYYL